MDENVKKVLTTVHAMYEEGTWTVDDGYISDHICNAVQDHRFKNKPDLTDECIKTVWRFACSGEFYADPESNLDDWEDGYGPDDEMATDEVVIDLLERVLEDA